MSFTTPCFIRKNTLELCNKLEKLGYKKIYSGTSNDVCIKTYAPDNFYVTLRCPININGKVIDCNENKPLFLALAALLDDTLIEHFKKH